MAKNGSGPRCPRRSSRSSTRPTAPSPLQPGPRILDGQELEPADIATTLRTDPAGRLTTTDGPFLETKEALGGYYLVEAADLDEVIELAARLYEVSAGHSGVEIRPVVDHG